MFISCIVACVLATSAFAQETASQFTRRVLAIDLDSIPFGSTPKEHPEFVRPSSAVQSGINNLVWYTLKDPSLAPANTINGRLQYGFLNDKLVWVEFTTNSFGTNSIDSKKQLALDKMRDEVYAARKKYHKFSDAMAAGFDDGNFGIGFVSMCSPMENFVVSVKIKKLPSTSDTGSAAPK